MVVFATPLSSLGVKAQPSACLNEREKRKGSGQHPSGRGEPPCVHGGVEVRGMGGLGHAMPLRPARQHSSHAHSNVPTGLHIIAKLSYLYSWNLHCVLIMGFHKAH